MMSVNKSTSWGPVADWYKDVVQGEGSYQRDLILPNLSRMMGVKRGERVLDLACGEGFMSREWSASGAEVTGIDISPELIAIAKKASPKMDFRVSSADDLRSLEDGSFDKAAMVLAVQNMENVQGVFKECFRVIRPGGSFYMVINHPCFRVPKNSSWGFDDVAKVQYRRVDRYLSETKVAIDMHPGEKKKETTASFHRPLQYYFKLLSKAGFCVARLEEWNSGKKSQPGPRAAMEDRARKEIPLFMAIECGKK